MIILNLLLCQRHHFQGRQQHDSHELLRFLLDGLQVHNESYSSLRCYPLCVLELISQPHPRRVLFFGLQCICGIKNTHYLFMNFLEIYADCHKLSMMGV